MEKRTSNTCLVAIKDKKGNLWFAADRRQSWGMHLYQVSPRSKLTKRNGVLLMGTGHSNVCDLVTDQMTIPDLIKDSYHYMSNIFMPALYNFLHEKGFLKDKQPKLNFDGSARIIVGVNSEAFEVTLSDEIIDFGCVNLPYAAGCGGAYAAGSLYTSMKNKKLKEKQILKEAIEAAAYFSAGCDNNIDILNNV